MGFPEGLWFSHKVVIVWVAWMGLSKRHSSGEKCEENDSGGEKIDGLAVVGLSKVDLGGHITRGSEFSVDLTVSIGALKKLSEAEVSNLQVKIVIEEEVFWFKVAMCETG